MAGLTQQDLARKLGSTQGYVSLLERGARTPSPSLTSRLVQLLNLPSTALHLDSGATALSPLHSDRAAKALGSLGYPGFAYLVRRRRRLNPVAVLLRALSPKTVDSRTLEALPWLLLHYEGFNQPHTVVAARDRCLQNRLGFVVALAKEVAENNADHSHRLAELDALLSALEPLRLANDDDFGKSEASLKMRRWVRKNRSKAAKHWNLLTDLTASHLNYAS